ncbi:hypothetical protein DEFDS_P247 (plasmid) [Deferribacter desulfuricans SSM1]|uniref:Uncharacterized protein n=1 Tax=Deferribacter desulfuricans (strain DSM 14783 / JCM 11476 / NBRC 101012 / SSM1) TaxID=639282 RepID=D3PF75_DEFDS|nr:hypothetical protein [Deferribacter desulfuricans]BAI81867.1 hypothetical protein DEFDS_P247 [Deferribacter desulfuricans SSM1]
MYVLMFESIDDLANYIKTYDIIINPKIAIKRTVEVENQIVILNYYVTILDDKHNEVLGTYINYQIDLNENILLNNSFDSSEQDKFIVEYIFNLLKETKTTNNQDIQFIFNASYVMTE